MASGGDGSKSNELSGEESLECDEAYPSTAYHVLAPLKELESKAELCPRGSFPRQHTERETESGRVSRSDTVDVAQALRIDTDDIASEERTVQETEDIQNKFSHLHISHTCSSEPIPEVQLGDKWFDNDLDTFLHLAVIFQSDINILCAVIQKLVDITGDLFKFLDFQNKLGQTALHLAALTNRPDTVKFLLELGADRSLRDRCLRTPLFAACEKVAEGASLELVRVFLCEDQPSKNTELDIQNHEGKTCLHFAVETGNLGMAKLLVNSGANVNSREGKQGFTPLHIAVARGDIHTTKLLLSCSDIDCEMPSFYGATALYLSLNYFHQDEIEDLLKARLSYSEEMLGSCG